MIKIARAAAIRDCCWQVGEDTCRAGAEWPLLLAACSR